LEAIYGPLTQYRLRAWGDTHGDHELLDAAQDAHWRHFHPAWRRSRSRYSKAGSPESVSPRDSHSNSEDQQGA
jgi:hypothetical protein